MNDRIKSWLTTTNTTTATTDTLLQRHFQQKKNRLTALYSFQTKIYNFTWSTMLQISVTFSQQLKKQKQNCSHWRKRANLRGRFKRLPIALFLVYHTNACFLYIKKKKKKNPTWDFLYLFTFTLCHGAGTADWSSAGLVSSRSHVSPGDSFLIYQVTGRISMNCSHYMLFSVSTGWRKKWSRINHKGRKQNSRIPGSRWSMGYSGFKENFR